MSRTEPPSRTPALFTRISISQVSAFLRSPSFVTSSFSTSKVTWRSAASRFKVWTWAQISTVAITSNPFSASRIAASRPKPVPAPVIKTVFMVISCVVRQLLSRLDEREQVGVDPILMRRREAVRRTGVVDLHSSLDQLGRLPRRVLNGNDLVIFAVHDQCRDVEFFEVLGEVGLGKGLDALVGVFRAGLHAPEPELIESTLGDLRSRSVGAVEGDGQLLIVLGPVSGDTRTNLVEHLHRQALGIGWRLEHDRRHCRDEDCLPHPLGAMTTDVASDLASTGRVANQRRVPQVERLDHG